MALIRPSFSLTRPTVTPTIGGGAAPTSAWTDADLSAFTKTDANGMYTASGSTLAVDSTIVLTASVHGRMDTMDALFFTYQLTAFDITKHYGLAVRATWGVDLGGTFELYVGVGNDSAPLTDAGVYLSTQLKATSASVGGNDYGQTPVTNQSVNNARYLAGAFNYRSDRQDGSVGQSANAARSVRAGQNRSVDPGTAMTDSTDQYILIGLGNQNASHSSVETLTGLQLQYQLLAHHGQD